MTKKRRPRSPPLLPCADCRVDTYVIGEYYMIDHKLWRHAWRKRRRPGAKPILCIGCVERRVGRTLMASDFIEAPVNNPRDPYMSERMRERVTAESFRSL